MENGMRRNTGPFNRHKSDHTQSSRGPLSTIKAVIKRTKPSSRSDQRRGNHRRCPEAPILSAEPLDCSGWSPGGAKVDSAPHCPPPPSQSCDQVPKQKTQEDHVKPVAPPRHLNCTSTTTTTTASTATTAAAATTTNTTTSGKKPPKPPRPSAPKNKKTSTATAGLANVNLTFTPTCTNQDFDSDVIEETNCTRSVTVHWKNTTSTKTSSDTTTTTTTTATTSHFVQCPVPLPRIKSKRPLIRPDKPQTLAQLSENAAPSNCSVSSNKYLEELLEVFNAENLDIFNSTGAEIEDADEMSAANSLRARIQAFESQAEAPEPVKPQPQARKRRPPVAAKPSVATKPQVGADDLYEDVPEESPPAPAPKPARKPLGKTNSVKEELSAVLAQHRTKRPVLTREDSIHSEEPPVEPVKEPLKPNLNINNHNNYAAPPVYDDVEDEAKASEEPEYEYEYEWYDVEKPQAEGSSGTADNYYEYPETEEDDGSKGPETTESQYDYVEYTPNKAPEKVPKTNEEKPPNILPVRPKPTMDNYGSRQSLTRRPTTIIVPSKRASFSDGLQESPPPLPVQMPVGASRAPPPAKRPSSASFPPQVSDSPIPEPALPPRRLTTSKTLPPRPPLPRSGPGRPPPPRMDAVGRSSSSPWDSPPKPWPQAPQKRGPVLPPRPNPGHRLYNKYTLQVPHAVASCDYSGGNNGELSFQKNEVLMLVNPLDSNTYECQVGDKKGRVHRSSMKVITPLSTAADVSATQGGKVTASGSGLTVEVLHDFHPENSGELCLKAGDVVTMVEQVDSEWYRGTRRDSSGFFPISYVKVLANSAQLPDTTSKKPPAAVSGPRCVARFDFEGEHSDELNFTEGDVIQLRAYVGQDWARGQLGAATGIFPLNFVEIVEDLPPTTSQQPTKPTKPTKIALPGMTTPSLTQVTRQAQSGSEWAVALYDFSGNADGDLSFETGDRILVTKHLDEEWSRGRLNGREGIFPRAFVASTTGKTSPPTSRQGGSGSGVSARALYDFVSDCDEELSLKVGDVVSNIESVDGEWFLGDLRGKRAMVPRNYVEVL